MNFIAKLFRSKTKIEKREDFSNMSLRYTDGSGKKYYGYDHDMYIPMIRMNEIQKTLLELGAAMTIDETEKAFKAIDANIDAVLNGEPASKLADSKFIIKEVLKTRKEIVVHENIYFKLVALTLIGEDENPETVDLEMTDFKVSVFKKESQGKRWVFFYGVGLKKYIPYFEKLKDGLTEYSTRAEIRMRAVKEMIDLISLDQKLSTT